MNRDGKTTARLRSRRVAALCVIAASEVKANLQAPKKMRSGDFNAGTGRPSQPFAMTIDLRRRGGDDYSLRVHEA